MTFERLTTHEQPRALFTQAFFRAVFSRSWLGFAALAALGYGLALLAPLPVVLVASVLVAGLYGSVLVAGKSAESQLIDHSRLSIGEILERQVEKGKRVSIQEPISGLLQKWYFELRLAEEVRRCRRYGMLMAVLRVTAPLTGQPRENSGPERELRLAQAVAHHLRAVDIAARIGEFEYVVCLPHTDLHGAQVAARRLTESLQEWSLGVSIATYPLDGSDVDTLLQTALTCRPMDASLLSNVVDLPAKRSFKNMIVRLQPEETAEAPLRATETTKQIRQKLHRAAKNAGIAVTIWEEDGRLLYKLAAAAGGDTEAA